MNQHPIILFDGICNFCNGTVNFIIKQDKKKIFRFAALQSESGEKLLKQYQLDQPGIDSFVLIDNGKAYTMTAAVLRLYNKLPWYWKWTQLFWIFPRLIRNFFYRLVAKNRYKWFGKREECIIPSPEIKERFLS